MKTESLSASESPRQRWRRHWVLWRYWLAREIKTRYAGSVLGVAWAVVQPVATLAIFYVLFGMILEIRIPDLDVNAGYLLHLLAGLAVWLPFTEAIGRGVASLVAYEDFLRKQPIPAEILPAVTVGGSLPALVIGYVLLLLVCLAQGLGPLWTWAWVPVLIGVQLVMCMGLTMLLSMAHFLWRDVGSLVTFALQLWFYLTPILYPLAQIPERFHTWFLFNPVACLALTVQWATLGIAVPVAAFWALALWTLVLGLGGWWFFRSMKSALGEAL